MENRIDQIFKEKLENFEKNPPVALLDQINQQMAFRSRVRHLNQIKSFVGIAAALVIALMAGWFTLDNHQLAENNIPVQIQEIATPSPSVSEKSAPAPTGLSKLAVQPRHFENTIANKPVRKPQREAAPSLPATSTSPSNIHEEIAMQTNDQSSTPGSVQGKELPASKKEQASDHKSNAGQKNAEALYFADSFNPETANKQKSTKGSWELKAELSPMFASQGLTGNSSTKSLGTMSGGMMASYRLNKKISISSGIRFAQMKQGTHTDYYLNAKSGITYLEPVDKSANIARDVSLYLPSTSSIVYSNGMQMAASSNIFKSDVSQDFKYLEIPVQATYKIIDNAFSVGVTGGISTNILIGNLASITENGIKLSQGSTDNLRDVIYSGSAGIEVGYGLGKNLILTVEPRIKQYMHSVSSNDLINFKPLQMGIFTGITYTFN